MTDRETGSASDRQTESGPIRRLNSRDPLVVPEDPFVAVLGGTETYGLYVDTAYPELLAHHTERTVLNLGCMHGGLTLMHDTPELLKIASQSDVTILQIPGAQNISNRLYMVHTRRNDRFLRASPILKSLYPELDFTDFNFTGHLIGGLHDASETSFRRVQEELRTAWVHRMLRVISLIEGDVVLLWMAPRSPDDPADGPDHGEPMFVTREMVEQVLPHSAGLVEVVYSSDAKGASGSVEGARAAALPNQSAHDLAAEKLAQAIGTEQGATRRRALRNVS